MDEQRKVFCSECRHQERLFGPILEHWSLICNHPELQEQPRINYVTGETRVSRTFCTMHNGSGDCKKFERNHAAT